MANHDRHDETSPLLQHGAASETEAIIIDFTKDDDENPRNWPRSRKFVNVGIIALMAVVSPLASSMFTPGINQIASDLQTTPTTVVGATTGFVVCLGLGPLVLAPLSETFGRRQLYMVCFGVFTLTQIPTALARNVAELIAWRTVSGFFGSIGIANGGGTISDMFHPEERAGVFGWYLLGPLLGPTLGPLFGGLITQNLGWRWVFWILTIVCATNTLAGFFFLRESYAPVILESRKRSLESPHQEPKWTSGRDAFDSNSYGDIEGNGANENQGDTSRTYRIVNQDDRPFKNKLLLSMLRPLRILFTQPIVLTMAAYQAVLFGTIYSLYTNFQAIFSSRYGFNTTQVGLAYLGPGVGFLIAVWFLVPRIDSIYNALTAKYDGVPQPEYRLPLANVGAVFVPLSLFWFGWTVEYGVHWAVPILGTVFFGVGMVTIINTAQNYYIDSFSKYAASAIAAGAVFRSLVGGVVPLGATGLFEQLGYGWGVSVFGFVALALSPAPLAFYYFGRPVRERFAIDL